MSGQSQPLREHKGLQWMCLMDKIQKKLLLCPLPFVNFSFSARAVTASQDVVTHVFRIHMCLLNPCFVWITIILLQIERRQIHRVGARTTGNRMLNMWEDGQTAAVWLRELLQLNPAMNLSCFCCWFEA